MKPKPSFSLWWTGATLACCLALYVAYPNDHSIVPALLGLLVISFFLFWALRLVAAVSKNWIAATKRKK